MTNSQVVTQQPRKGETMKPVDIEVGTVLLCAHTGDTGSQFTSQAMYEVFRMIAHKLYVMDDNGEPRILVCRKGNVSSWIGDASFEIVE